MSVVDLAVRLINEVKHDFLKAPMDSAAYRTARMFIRGEKCKHIICEKCLNVRGGWRTGECPPPPAALDLGCACIHPWRMHSIYEFDWEEHRNLIIGASGLDVTSFVERMEKKHVRRNVHETQNSNVPVLQEAVRVSVHPKEGQPDEEEERP